jgi:hypothetical protein
MAGINEKPVTSGINYGGLVDLGQGMALYAGSGAFTTTGATAVINHPFGTGDIFSAVVQFTETTIDAQDTHISFKQGTAANELSRNTDFGTYKAVTSGKATVQREGTSGLSGATFSIIMIGRARH